jgi:hypothetical protein
MATDVIIKPFHQRSLKGQVGIHSQTILQGPQSITLPETGEKLSFYGWATLALRTVSPTLPSQFESRIVYANLHDTEQEFVILRAAFWDWKVARQAIQEQGESYKPVIPVRFIKIPIDQLKGWLSNFIELSIIVGGFCENNDKIPIRGLRVERDYTACIFEKVWQAEDSEHIPLNSQWNQIWQQMTEALTTAPIITYLVESFWLTQMEINYDFQLYRPNHFEF